MSIYDDMQSLTREIMREFAQGSVFLLSVTPGVGPIDEPGEPTITPYELDAAARGVSFKYVQSGLANASDTQVTTSAKAGVPVPKGSDFLLLDGVQYKIVNVIRKPDAGTTVAYVMIARR